MVEENRSQIKLDSNAEIEEQDKQEEVIQEKFQLWDLKSIIDVPRKIRQHKKITIDLTKCSYDVIKLIAQDKFTWNVITDNPESTKDFNIIWNDQYIQEEELRRLLPYQKINRFPGSYNLGRKNFLARNLTKLKKVHPEDYDFIPKTWLLPFQYEDLRQFLQKFNYTKMLIVKPDNQSQGKGIFLTRKIEGVIEYGEQYVVQEYIQNPLLIDGLKFDLRIYVLLKSVNPLKVFIYKEGLARFSTVKYEKPTGQNLNDMCMHLTNYAINKVNPNFIFNEKEMNDDIGHKRSLSSCFKSLKQMNVDIENLWNQIKKIVVCTLCSCNPYLSHTYKSCQPKEQNSEMAFEIFGFDVMIDEHFRPWLLEVNHTPSFTTDTPLDDNIKQCLILDTLILENILWKTRKQYYDTRQQLSMNPNIKGVIPKLTKEEIDDIREKITKWEDNNHGAYQRIYPTADTNLQKKYQSFLKTAQDQFDDFSGAKINRIRKEKDNNKDTFSKYEKKESKKEPQRQPTEPLSSINKKQYKINFILNNKQIFSKEKEQKLTRPFNLVEQTLNNIDWVQRQEHSQRSSFNQKGLQDEPLPTQIFNSPYYQNNSLEEPQSQSQIQMYSNQQSSQQQQITYQHQSGSRKQYVQQLNVPENNLNQYTPEAQLPNIKTSEIQSYLTDGKEKYLAQLAKNYLQYGHVSSPIHFNNYKYYKPQQQQIDQQILASFKKQKELKNLEYQQINFKTFVNGKEALSKRNDDFINNNEQQTQYNEQKNQLKRNQSPQQNFLLRNNSINNNRLIIQQRNSEFVDNQIQNNLYKQKNQLYFKNDIKQSIPIKCFNFSNKLGYQYDSKQE